MTPDRLSATFSALADPTWRAILAKLATGEKSVTELTLPFALTMPAISKHLRVLERAGLITRTRDAQRRPRQLRAAPLREVSEWVERYRGMWEERFDRLDSYLKAMQKRSGPMAKNDESQDLDFVISRVFMAPRALVWKAWTEAEHLAAWWGPHRFQNRCEVDLRPGGAYRIVMVDPDGVDYPMKGFYREVVAPERLVYTSDLSEHPESWHDLVNPNRDKSKGLPALTLLNTVTFAEHDGLTTLTVRSRFETTELRDAFVRMGMTEGWTESLERLESKLGEGTGDQEIIASRLFSAPRDLVWRMWTEPEHIVHWWGPIGFTNTTSQMDVRQGGVWRSVMHGPDGTDYQNVIIYRELVKPSRIVYTHESGPNFHVVVSFVEEGQKTRLTMRMRFDSAALREEVATKFGAVEGMLQTLERLGERLTTLR